MTARRNKKSNRGKNRKRKSNRGKIFLMTVVCIGVIAAGFIGLTSGSDGKESGKEASGASASAPDYGDLLDVKLPKRLPSQEKEYEGFRVSFNKDNRTPNYSAWELLKSETDGAKGRTNNFWQDEEIENCPVTKDYSNSGFDRGHLCPAADQKWSARAMEDCFVMANICPQDHSLNSGAWSTLEKKERHWADRDSALVIVAGPIYEPSDTRRVGAAGVRVPSAFFKVFLAPYLSEPRAIGFVYPNMSAPGNMQDYAMTVDEVEKLTGFDFFHTLPDDLENDVESKFSFKEWNRR